MEISTLRRQKNYKFFGITITTVSRSQFLCWSSSNMMITAASICSGHFGHVAPQLHVLLPPHWGILANCDNQELKSQQRRKNHFGIIPQTRGSNQWLARNSSISSFWKTSPIPEMTKRIPPPEDGAAVDNFGAMTPETRLEPARIRYSSSATFALELLIFGCRMLCIKLISALPVQSSAAIPFQLRKQFSI